MTRSRVLGCVGGLAALAALGGCSGGGSDAATPAGGTTLSVSLMDAPVDGVTAVWVRITSMWIKPTNGPAVQLPLERNPYDVNLLALTDSNAAILVDEAVIEPGEYEWIAMDIAAQRNVRDSYVLTETGGEEEMDLFVPSNRLRLVSGFEVGPNSAVRLLFDWDMRQGLVYPPGQGRYLLKPAFRMIDVTEYGVLEGTIDADTVGTSLDPTTNACAADDEEDLDVGNVVYVFAGDVASDELDDVDDSDDPLDLIDPIATLPATREENGDYTYRTLVDPGTYTVVFTCQAGNDDPVAADDDLEFLAPANTTNPVTNSGGVTVVDF